MDDILEFIKDLLKEYLGEIMKKIVQFPGALIFWVFKGFKTKFKSEWRHKKRNMTVGAVFWLVFIALTVLMLSQWLSSRG